ncbi:hypothetical protein [Rhizobium sp. AB2/73]|uniref:hypothetical protein n=1 Tax=Rhizobium TaxID=379 RepID=UPI0013B04926|nr:hypothetical protein [Rhizobium sp. AB2/73]QYA16787.1 hypothetical protein J5284_28255 [Rhizobium sp. AB2/73]UEQ84436.1 hypothetical protein I8E17_29585 [Rhizobium sp. AB2/73]
MTGSLIAGGMTEAIVNKGYFLASVSFALFRPHLAADGLAGYGHVWNCEEITQSGNE